MYLGSQFAGTQGTYFLGAPLSSRRMVRRGRRLGSITADQAAQSAMPQNTIRNTAGFTQAVYAGIVAAADAGNFVQFNPSGCQGIKPSGAMLLPGLASTAGSLLLKFGAGNPIALGIGAAAAVGGVVFGAIFGHHAAAIQKEQSVICAVVPAASDALTALYQAVQAGTLDPATAAGALDSLLTQFRQQVQSILKMDTSHCNAACVWVKTLQAIVAKKKSEFADLAAAQNAAAAASAASSPAASLLQPVEQVIQSAGLPAWALPAAGFFLLWKLL